MTFYHASPPTTVQAVAEKINFLARWLPSDEDMTVMMDWTAADWESAESVVYWQNVLPWFVARLSSRPERVPPEVAARLHRLDADSRLRTQRLLDCAAELITALRATGGELLPLKGGVLAPVYYPDPLSRPMWDLDILIKPVDMAATEAILLGQGFTRRAAGLRGATYVRGQWSPDNIWSPAYQEVEVHSSITHTGAYKLALEEELVSGLWQGATRQPFWGNIEALLPTRAGLLQHVCVHATQHWLERRGLLIYLADVWHLTLQMTTADWQALLAQTSPLSARFVYAALAVAQRYAPAPIPADVLAGLKRHCSARLVAWVADMTPADVAKINPLAPAATTRLEAVFSQSKRELVGLWWRKFFPARRELLRFQALLPVSSRDMYARLVRSPLWPVGYLFINGNRLRLRQRKG